MRNCDSISSSGQAGVNGHITPAQRFRGGHRCPICDGSDDDHRGQGKRCHGYLSSDGKWAHCTREDHAGNARFNARTQTFAHKLKGPCPCGVEHAPADPEPARKKRGEIERSYGYVDENSQLLFEAVRFKNPKGFAQRRPDGNGRWTWNLKGVRLIPYRLPELLAADPGDVVVIPEGEKDVDRLRALGLVATCNPMGAGKWRSEYSASLRGRKVAIIPDNDDPGRNHAHQVARSLANLAAEVKVVELPDLPKGGDVSDFLDRGGTAEDLRRLIAEAPPWVPESQPPGPGRSEGPDGSPGGKRPLTDLGNAERLVDRHGEDMRFCHPWGRWLIWDGRRWDLDKTGASRRRARRTVRAIYSEAADEDDEGRRKEVVRWGQASEKRDRISAMIYLAEAEEGVPILPEQMNSDPWLFNCLNGTIDLRTGRLRPHRREDLITQLCPVDFDPNAPCPLWLSTLDLVFHRESPGLKAELIDYWQRLCGYAMAGVVRDHILPIAYGTGANGKSTILGTLMEVFGPDYAMKCPPDMLMTKKSDSHPTDRADLFGKRLVVAIETESGRRLNETMVKELTGGDPIRARRMREDFWQFIPTHTLIMATNHKPVIRGTDHGVWRRPKLVPFTVRIEDEKADKAMPEKLRAELPGVLAWGVRGCLEWQERGLDTPAEVIDATDGYRREQDLIGAFLEECTLSGPNFREKAGALYARYKAWAETGGEYVVTQTAFGMAIQERGIEKRISDGKWYLGITLKDDGTSESRERGEL